MTIHDGVYMLDQHKRNEDVRHYTGLLFWTDFQEINNHARAWVLNDRIVKITEKSDEISAYQREGTNGRQFVVTKFREATISIYDLKLNLLTSINYVGVHKLLREVEANVTHFYFLYDEGQTHILYDVNYNAIHTTVGLPIAIVTNPFVSEKYMFCAGNMYFSIKRVNGLPQIAIEKPRRVLHTTKYNVMKHPSGEMTLVQIDPKRTCITCTEQIDKWYAMIKCGHSTVCETCHKTNPCQFCPTCGEPVIDILELK